MSSKSALGLNRKEGRSLYFYYYAIKNGAFIFIAFSILMLSVIGSPITESLRGTFLDLATHTVKLTVRPFQTVSLLLKNSASYLQLNSKYMELKSKVEELEHWEAIARQFFNENAKLRTALHMGPKEGIQFITAEAYDQIKNKDSHTLLIDAGRAQGVEKDQVVVSNLQIIGRVIDVGERSARVLLINDIKSRVPAVTEVSQNEGILSGSKFNQLILSLSKGDRASEVGEFVFTTGKGGIFPKGYKIGTIESIDGDKIVVHSAIDWDNINYVQVITSPLEDIVRDKEEKGEIS
ncbi:MAG: rod shape-determining protein MreC [Caedimonadaceae bacterium]|nr:MAG: rod shape-determining protein MreC [Caedimonadaceae bacterium]